MELSSLFFKLVKFCVVGFSGMAVDFGITWLCKEKLHINKYVSNSVGFALAATNNYVWNRLWTFQSTAETIPQEFASFFTISLVGLGLNNFFIYLFHGKLKLNFYLSKVFAIGLVTLWNFFMNYLITFAS